MWINNLKFLKKASKVLYQYMAMNFAFQNNICWYLFSCYIYNFILKLSGFFTLLIINFIIFKRKLLCNMIKNKIAIYFIFSIQIFIIEKCFNLIWCFSPPCKSSNYKLVKHYRSNIKYCEIKHFKPSLHFYFHQSHFFVEVKYRIILKWAIF